MRSKLTSVRTGGRLSPVCANTGIGLSIAMGTSFLLNPSVTVFSVAERKRLSALVPKDKSFLIKFRSESSSWTIISWKDRGGSKFPPVRVIELALVSLLLKRVISVGSNEFLITNSENSNVRVLAVMLNAKERRKGLVESPVKLMTCTLSAGTTELPERSETKSRVNDKNVVS